MHPLKHKKVFPHLQTPLMVFIITGKAITLHTKEIFIIAEETQDRKLV
jgi:hypothetical protein